MCKFAITSKKDSFVAKIVNTRLTKIFMSISSPDERLPSSATLDTTIQTYSSKDTRHQRKELEQKKTKSTQTSSLT